MPLDEKLKYKLTNASVNQGYTADGVESNGGVDHKECFEFRRFKNDLCPSEDVIPSFRTTLDDFYGAIDYGSFITSPFALGSSS